MTAISNLNTYNTEMKKSMADKLFFLDIIDPASYTTFIDFGCADGVLLEEMNKIKPDLNLVGIDMNEDMLDLAQNRVPAGEFINASVPVSPSILSKKNIMNLSSVLHEVYSYSTHAQEIYFWESLNNCNTEYIVIRDMIYNESNTTHSLDTDEYLVRKKADSKQLAKFEREWGSINYYKNLVHFLLKYRYTKNWDREVKENYLNYSTDDIIRNIDHHKYSLIYRKDYILPFLYTTIKKDFGIELTTVTHTNLIFKRRRHL